MDKITICDLEVFYHVGVPDDERAREQRLLVTVEMTHDLSVAVASDNLSGTIDYYAVAQRLQRFGEGRSWKLIERLAADIAEMILSDFRAQVVVVEVKKFILPDARHVSVTVTRSRRAN
jgi:7,8-dihydroneopterin aldolase/epimerase/oxygenase